MTDWVCDYAWARPAPSAIAAAGFKAVCRYLSHDRTGKTLSTVEAAALHAAGLGVVLNFEDSAGRPSAGFAAGQADAAFANDLADNLGAPHDVPIYYSCDTDPGSPPSSAIVGYFRGAASVGRRPVGAYGGAVLIQALLTQGIVTFGWTANAGSWNHGVAPVGHLHQVYSHPAGSPAIAGTDPAAYDVSQVLNQAFGAWGGPAPAPIPTTRKETEVSGTFRYDHDGFTHRMWVADVPTNHAKVGDLLHLFGLPDATHPAGKVENMTQTYAPHLGPQEPTQPVEFRVSDNGVTIEGTTIDKSGAVTRWAFEGNPITWHCVPFFPA